MKEPPEEWLERLFEYEFCAECGGDAEDHEICIVPGIGNYFARCKRTGSDTVTNNVVDDTAGGGVDNHAPSEVDHDRVDRR